MKNVHIHQEVKEINPINKNKRSQEEIYQALINRLRIIATHELSDQEAHSAARNLIGFCQEIINYKTHNKQQKINERKRHDN